MDLIILTFTDKWDDWERDGFPSRSAALSLALSEEPRVRHVLVVDVPSSILAAARVDAPGPHAFSLRRARPDITVLDHVRCLPRERHHPFALRLNGAVHDRALAAHVRAAAQELGMEDAVALHAGPLTVGLFGKLGEAIRVYDAVDEWAVHPAFSRMRPTIRRAYDTIRSEADLVTAVSRPLAALFEGDKPRVAVVHNGVGSDFVEQPALLRRPPDLAALRGPLVGYVGALQDRIDTALLESAAASMPEVTFCLVGPLAAPEHFARLQAVPNVRFLGPKNHDVLPDYVRSFDACVMPHLDTPLTRMMDPIKLREYAAAGRPIVMTAVGDWEAFVDVARVVHSPEEFKTELERVLSEGVASAEGGSAYGARHSWERRATELLDRVEEVTDQKRAAS